jgi:hypothetical protein
MAMVVSVKWTRIRRVQALSPSPIKSRGTSIPADTPWTMRKVQPDAHSDDGRGDLAELRRTGNLLTSGRHVPCRSPAGLSRDGIDDSLASTNAAAHDALSVQTSGVHAGIEDVGQLVRPASLQSSPPLT